MALIWGGLYYYFYLTNIIIFDCDFKPFINASDIFSSMNSIFRWLAVFLFLVQVTGCAVLAIADAAVTVAATTVKTTTKAVGAVADVVIPDKKEKDPAAEK